MAETVPGASGAVGASPRFALGIGLTNECNLSCAFCYRDPSRVDRLDLEQVRAVLDRLPVQSVNLGTGENGMHPRFRETLALLRSRNVKLTMTSNGLSVAVLGDDELRAFHDLEFSLDYPTREEQDAERDAGVSRRSLGASGMRAVRAARSMRRGMRRPPAARQGARSTRSVLPHRARRTATAADAHRVGPRSAQGRQRLHHDRHGALVDGDELSSAPRPRRFLRQSHRAAPSSAPYSTRSAHPGTAQGTPTSRHTT